MKPVRPTGFHIEICPVDRSLGVTAGWSERLVLSNGLFYLDAQRAYLQKKPWTMLFAYMGPKSYHSSSYSMKWKVLKMATPKKVKVQIRTSYLLCGTLLLLLWAHTQGDVRGQHRGIEANRKELNFILILCGGGQVIVIIIIIIIVMWCCSLSTTIPRSNKNPTYHFQGGNSKQQGEKVASDVGRQIRQADVMLKSAVLLTKRLLRYVT